MKSISHREPPKLKDCRLLTLVRSPYRDKRFRTSVITCRCDRLPVHALDGCPARVSAPGART